MPELKPLIQRAIQLADRLPASPEREGVLSALGRLWTQASLTVGNSPVLLAAAADVLELVEATPQVAGLEALAACAEDIESAIAARRIKPGKRDRRRAKPLTATVVRLALHPAPELPFVAQHDDEVDDDVDLTEPTEEELLGAPTAPASWFEEDADAPDDEPALDASLGRALEQRMGLAIVDLDADPPTAVVLADEGGEPVSRQEVYGRIVASCAEKTAALGRDRYRLPWSERPRAEERILELVDAFAACGPGRLRALMAWWLQTKGDAEGWAGWATSLFLGCTAGEDAAIALVQCTLALSGEDRTAAVVMAESLGIAPHPELPRWALGWASSAHPVQRALGIDVLARHGQLDEEEILAHLDDGSPLVAEFAVRALERRGQPSEEAMARLRRATRMPAMGAAWRASRLLTLLKDETPYRQLLEGGPLYDTLGTLALEIFVLHGEIGVRDAFAACQRQVKPNVFVLDALSRFGHPGAVGYLAHFLAEEDLAEAAERGLAVLYGDLVDPAERRSAAAWQRAVRAKGFDPHQRLRRGRPWSLAGVVLECRESQLSERALRVRIDELTMRTDGAPHVDLSAWTCDVDPILRDIYARFT